MTKVTTATTKPAAEEQSFKTYKGYPFFAKDLPCPPEPQQLVNQLRDAVLGGTSRTAGRQPQVLGRDDHGFSSSAAIFNGSVKSPALALVKPTSALHVSRTIVFCKDNGLEVSVKSGGNGVHGWSVAGHVILDLSLLNDVSMAPPSPYPPTPQGSFEAIHTDDLATTTPSLLAQQTPSDSAIKRPADSVVEEGTDSDGLRGKRRFSKSTVVGGPLVSSGNESNSRDEGRGSSSHNAAQLPSVNTTPTSFPPAASPASSTHPRITYVNPSKTPTSSFPFLPPTVGPSSSSSLFLPGSGYQPSYLNLFPQQQAVFNTNPNPPPYMLVTFGAGVGSKQLDTITASSPYGAFHVPTSAFPVGTGQFLSGGFGFLGRKHGFAMDNLVEVEMVLADGRIIWVGEGGTKGGEWKEGEDPKEVWWAIRGAGSIIGVVTRFKAKAYYVPSVYAGNLIYLFDHNTTPSLLQHVRDCIKGAPPTVYANIILTAGPPGAPAIVVFQLCFSGKNARLEGETYVQAISSWEGGRSLFMDFSERAFEKQQLAVEEVLKGGSGRKWFIESDLLLSLTDEVIDESCARFDSIPDGCTWLFEYTSSSVLSDPQAVSDSCFPASHRAGAFTVVALHQWRHDETPEEDTRCVVTAQDWIEQLIHFNSPGGPLPCFLQTRKIKDIEGVYGQENFKRLKQLKNQLDPDNTFKHASWPNKDD
ncbi:hypothetical protein L204_100245 [Cryptococcus depauperatus]